MMAFLILLDQEIDHCVKSSGLVDQCADPYIPVLNLEAFHSEKN